MKTYELRLFAILLIVLLGESEVLFAYNVLYTQGEVMQGLYWLLVCLNIAILALAFVKPRCAMWASLGLAMILIPWQTIQNRKLVQLHEDVMGVVRCIEGKNDRGSIQTT